MTDQTEQVLATLRELMAASESDTARIQAAKILLERSAPKEDDEARRREAEEREFALAEARGLLAEFAALKLAGLCEPGAMDQAGAPEPDHAIGGVAHLAADGGQGLGENAHGG
ncbi:MAG: hypothetical protein P4M15_13570 [Alphaproteobacteria bacterium]|nr:hypothetical protein [Alphaproteobacteria bacterium]